MLDRFIKDTTHELNTPIAAILSNIQMINKDNIDEKLAKKINKNRNRCKNNFKYIRRFNFCLFK